MLVNLTSVFASRFWRLFACGGSDVAQASLSCSCFPSLSNKPCVIGWLLLILTLFCAPHRCGQRLPNRPFSASICCPTRTGFSIARCNSCFSSQYITMVGFPQTVLSRLFSQMGKLSTSSSPSSSVSVSLVSSLCDSVADIVCLLAIATPVTCFWICSCCCLATGGTCNVTHMMMLL